MARKKKSKKKEIFIPSLKNMGIRHYLFLAFFILAFLKLMGDIRVGSGEIFLDLLIVIGASSNLVVLLYNGFKMPVIAYTEEEMKYYKSRNRHFGFYLREDVSFPFLADVFMISIGYPAKKEIRNGKLAENKHYVLKFSVGDVLIFWGLILYLLTF